MKIEPVLTDKQAIDDLVKRVRFDGDGLVPAVVQDVADHQVLMLAYMNRESLVRTLESGRTWFFSRSRNSLWLKGETSGHFQYVRELRLDCDSDTLLVQVEQVGNACHEGYHSCFFQTIGEQLPPSHERMIDELYSLICERKQTLPEGSYTASLFTRGVSRIAQKVGEEAVETAIAAVNRNRGELISESADLVYHLLVLLAECGVTPAEIRGKLAERRNR